MNSFQPSVGGHPLYLDDLVFLQNAYAQAFANITNYFSPTGNSIIWGIVVDTSGANITYTAGAVVIAGEVLSVPAGSFPNSFNPADQLYFLPQQEAVPPSPDTYEDQSLKNVHFVRTAILKYYDSSTDSGGTFYSSTLRADAGDIRDWAPPAGTTVSDFFDPTGLGINSKAGWALCNGLHNTPDLRGFTVAMATNVPSSGAGPVSGQTSGVTTNPGDVAGANLQTLSQANLPNVALPVTDPGHDHTMHGQGAIKDDASHSTPSWYLSISNGDYSGAGGANLFGRSASPDTNMRTGMSTSTGITVDTGGSDTPFDNRSAVKYYYKIMKLN